MLTMGFPPWDMRALSAVYGGARGPWGPMMVGLTVLGSGWSAIALLPMAGHTRTRGFARALGACIVLQAIAVWAIKRSVGRVRPWIALGLPAPIGTPRDPSFPSGHAAGSFCVAAFLAVALPVLCPGRPRLYRFAIPFAGLLAMLVAFSRVYLGAHFPIDVAGGAVLGAVVGATGAELYRRASPA